MVATAGSNLIIDSAACYLESSLEYWKEREVKTMNASRVMRRATRIIQRSMKQSSTQSGDEVLEKIEFLLAKGFGIKRSEMQVDIHKNFIISCLPKIFQESWTQNKARIMKRFNVKQVSLSSFSRTRASARPTLRGTRLLEPVTTTARARWLRRPKGH